MKIIKVKDYREMSKTAADLLLTRVADSLKLTIGLATGGTQVGL